MDADTKRYSATIQKDEITLSPSRERADCWRVVCDCGYCGIPHLTPKIAERDKATHMRTHVVFGEATLR